MCTILLRLVQTGPSKVRAQIFSCDIQLTWLQWAIIATTEPTTENNLKNSAQLELMFGLVQLEYIYLFIFRGGGQVTLNFFSSYFI